MKLQESGVSKRIMVTEVVSILERHYVFAYEWKELVTERRSDDKRGWLVVEAGWAKVSWRIRFARWISKKALQEDDAIVILFKARWDQKMAAEAEKKGDKGKKRAEEH